MSGEIYFEVKPDKTKPFRVKMKDGTLVQVYGTSFNINDYGDENMSKTTLLTGSVSVISEMGRSVLKPGQQAQLKKEAGGVKIIDDVDVDQVMAWQKGMFEFNNTDLLGIMRQVSRWYDVDVVYDSKPTNKKYGGGISRKLPLSNVLKMLEANGVKFSLEGRTLRVQQ
jgi:ferric-dicitrate binding protein FerR (iron transport regulator)